MHWYAQCHPSFYSTILHIECSRLPHCTAPCPLYPAPCHWEIMPPLVHLNIKGPYMHNFSIGSAFRVSLAYRSQPMLCSPYTWKSIKKRCKTWKIAFGGLQMLNNFVSETHRVRVSSHSAHIWKCCAPLVFPIAILPMRFGPIPLIPCFSLYSEIH